MKVDGYCPFCSGGQVWVDNCQFCAAETDDYRLYCLSQAQSTLIQQSHLFLIYESLSLFLSFPLESWLWALRGVCMPPFPRGLKFSSLRPKTCVLAHLLIVCERIILVFVRCDLVKDRSSHRDALSQPTRGSGQKEESPENDRMEGQVD